MASKLYSIKINSPQIKPLKSLKEKESLKELERHCMVFIFKYVATKIVSGHHSLPATFAVGL